MPDKQVSVSITIDRPRRDLWDYITTPATWQDWYGYSVEVIPDWQEGAILKMGGQQPRIDRCVAPSLLAWGKGMSLTLTALDASSTSVELGTVVSDPLGDPIFVGELEERYRESFAEILDDLRRSVEQPVRT